MALSGVRISWLMRARKSVFCEEARLGHRARLGQFFLGALPLRDVAHDGAKAAVVGQPADGHEQRNEAPLRLAADHLAAVIQHARHAVLRQAGEIVARRALAFDGKQRGEGLAGHLVAVEAEQRFGRAADRADRAVACEISTTPSVAVSMMVRISAMRALSSAISRRLAWRRSRPSLARDGARPASAPCRRSTAPTATLPRSAIPRRRGSSAALPIDLFRRVLVVIGIGEQHADAAGLCQLLDRP